MTETTFSYLWEEAVEKVVDNVWKSIPKKDIDKYHFIRNDTEVAKIKIRQSYGEAREKVRSIYFDVGEDETNLMDVHKVCSCFTKALLEIKMFHYDLGDEEVSLKLVYSNYEAAFLIGIHMMYLFLLSDYDAQGSIGYYEKLEKQATFYFPETNPGHDAYAIGRIKTLAINDICGNDFDLLTYADMLYWIEKYNKELIEK